MIHPENSSIFYLLARTYAYDKDMNSALRYLDKAIRAGYNDRETIENESAFISFTSEKKLKQIMEQLK
jgi:hypothetical protein